MRRIVFLVLCLGALAGGPVRAAEPVDLELVLLADASGSIDDQEILFQREGYARAITDPKVLEAIASTGYGRIAVIYVEWGQADSQEVVVGWTVIDGAESAAAFADALVMPPRMAYGRNAIGAALLAGKRLIEENELAADRLVIDFSGDSANSWSGPTIAEAREAVLAAGIVINGLPVLCRDCWSGQPVEYDLVRAFENLIIGGPGAFVIAAESRDKFYEAVRRKLILEIAGVDVRYAGR